MVVANKPGRPKKDSGINGRDKLVRATQEYLRKRPKIRLTRNEIAEACGVTPALISYYFRDKDSLLVAVVKPTIIEYQRRLVSVINDTADQAERIRRIIRLLIEMNANDGFVIDYMLNHVGMDRLDSEDRQSADFFRATLSHAIGQLMSSGRWQLGDPDDTRLSLWATCRVLGEKLQHQIEHQSLNELTMGDALDQSVNFIMNLFDGSKKCDISMSGGATPASINAK